MKKLSKVVLAGALALGGFTGLAALDAKPAAAAENVQKAPTVDNWPFKTLYELAKGTTALPDFWINQFKPAYYTGDTLTFSTNWVDQASGNALKIYRVLDDKELTLARYQTLYPNKDWNGTEWRAAYRTPITSVYENGSYIAVLDVDGTYYRSQVFTINQ
ncbi:DUF5065 family protein [Bacillus cereus]|uniref:DUF5065 domain-containing protein n=6 Tax=Bacillus TaxID=1386 RepID=A0ABD6SI85_BACTU|nr:MULTISPECIES: DUF5065 family protein [Bacillus cereus group]EOO05635.1 hypothetical protein IAW_05301 [Bacillus cereus str. Schrouff]EOO82134.1 hypothetical protein IGY_05394 [Bacillus cereus K-5975c]KGT40670.1 hypothetical protein IY08_28840 [Bacillus cereus]KXZ03528.1 hypothetical protein AT281_25875 [Bacillus cereus]MBJ8090390.1 DUF5065 family protein [Bacillus cereus]